ncbi:uncharacterized protein (DUF608 family) [Haloactinopolyspora alba]|uniref:Uncharacterized protein (DUF608 family) n=1 Tax=Haloactinopolyspora alba TaxID=648780 RepID=A0A2P8E6P8_9ACTN|nr:GH116 family glycosyl-hydrolase [Haloactinopolyspora alba]PSL05144.1 uncharacterized protein (DUF608 family) [Haloactinopolyspora alba]
MSIRRHARAHTNARHTAMPLGGIGTGNVSICADGSLRQWQLHNIGNHVGTLPDSFFALRLTRIEPPLDVLRVLQAAPPTESTETPLVTDDHIPQWQRQRLGEYGGFAGSRFSATYPVAEVEFADEDVPLDVRLEALTPLVPPDVEKSSLPVTMLTFTLRNDGEVAVHGTLGGALQNAVGWDGVSPIDGVRGAGYGGNTNRLLRDRGWTGVLMENTTLPDDDPGAGQMVLAADSSEASVLTQWRDAAEFMTYLASRAPASGAKRLAHAPSAANPQRHGPRAASGASPAGSTWNGGVGVPFRLDPGQETTIRFAITWHFPNRYVNFEQFGPARPEWGKSRFWLGNAYTTRFADAHDVFRRVRDDWDDLRAETTAWTSTFAGSTLSDAEVEHLAAQLAVVRSPTCFQSAEGDFFGFEGVLGASTVMWSGSYGGSCPLNCTHVWNYEHALARTFPSLERSMRRLEFEVMQHPDGYVPHRLIAPTYLPQLWDEFIGGPGEPALDGMLGTVLKTYREYRAGAGDDWLATYWPRVRLLLDHVRRHWDPKDTGVLRGVQPSTHDIDLCGVNSFMGTFWLAALRAGAEMARRMADDQAARELTELFRLGSASYDELLFDGEYYTQVLDDGESPDFQWGAGCLSDQLIGQWWAHELDLGYLLPADHVRSALSAVVRHNLREGFRDFHHDYRVFADADDTGLLMCSWPKGGRPDVPTRYADEVWTGSEYQVAAHCLREGLDAEAGRILDGLWTRYDGRRRNPYNEIECGDHYARSMAGWSVLDALSGVRFDAPSGRLTLRGDRNGTWPVVLDGGWGSLTVEDEALRLSCASGRFALRRIKLDAVAWPHDPTCDVDGVNAPAFSIRRTADGPAIEFGHEVRLAPGQSMRIRHDQVSGAR